MTQTGCWIWNLSVCMTEVAPFCHLAGDKVIWIYSAEFNSLLNETCIFFYPRKMRLYLYCAYCIQHTWVCRLLSFPFSFVYQFSKQKASRFLIREPVNRDFFQLIKCMNGQLFLFSIRCCFVFARQTGMFLICIFVILPNTLPPENVTSTLGDKYLHILRCCCCCCCCFGCWCRTQVEIFFLQVQTFRFERKKTKVSEKWRRGNEIYK